MEFEDVLAQLIALLQHQGRISYGVLKRRFKLDDDYLEDLKIELIEAQRLAVDENERILGWVGEPDTAALPVAQPVTDTEQAPATYTPLHLAEKFLPPALPLKANASRSPSCLPTSKTQLS
jgi:hypothetical protein